MRWRKKNRKKENQAGHELQTIKVIFLSKRPKCLLYIPLYVKTTFKVKNVQNVPTTKINVFLFIRFSV